MVGLLILVKISKNYRKQLMLDILFIHPNASEKIYQDLSKEHSAIEPPIWAGMLANHCRNRGFNVEILDCECEQLDYNQAAQEIVYRNPRFACFVVYGQQPSASTQNIEGAIGLAKTLKQISNITTIFVGGHIAAVPYEVLKEDCVDLVCQNEGVYTLSQLLNINDISNYKFVKGLGFKQNNNLILNPIQQIITQSRLDQDLSGVAWDLLPSLSKYRTAGWHSWTNNTEKSPFAALYTSLGCPFKCDFCCINIINRTQQGNNISAKDSSLFRYWTPEHTIKQFDYFAENGIRNIKIADELFVLNPNHFLKLCDLIIERKYDFNIWCYARVDTCKPKYLSRLKKAGVNWLGLGIECLTPDTWILCNDSIKQIKNVKKGDKVLSYNTNKLLTQEGLVLDIKTKNKNTLTINSGCSSITCSYEHKFFILDEECSLKTKNADQLKVNDYILSYNKIQSTKTDKISANEARLLGYIIGDGYIGKGEVKISAAKKERYLLKFYQKIALKLKYNANIRETTPTVDVLSLTGKNTLMKMLDKTGLIGTKSHTKFVPIEIIQSSNKVIAQFIAGLWDADGCIYYNIKKPHSYFSNYLSLNNKFLIEQIKYLLKYNFNIDTLNIKTYKDKRYEDKYQHYLYIKRKYSHKLFLDHIPIEAKHKLNHLKEYFRHTKHNFKQNKSIKIPLSILKIVSQNVKKQRKLQKQGVPIHNILATRTTRDGVSLNNWNKFTNYIQISNIQLGDIFDRFNAMLKSGIIPEKILHITKNKEKSKLYDLVINSTNTYFANGLLVHNSGNVNVRKNVSKNQFEGKIHDIVRNINDAGIEVGTNYIFGLPDDNLDTMQETYDLAVELNTTMVNMYATMAYPGSYLYLQAKENGWQLPDRYCGYSQHSYYTQNLSSKYCGAKEILKFRDDAWRKYNERSEYLDKIRIKFGESAYNNIKDSLQISLKRRLLGD